MGARKRRTGRKRGGAKGVEEMKEVGIRVELSMKGLAEVIEKAEGEGVCWSGEGDGLAEAPSGISRGSFGEMVGAGTEDRR